MFKVHEEKLKTVSKVNGFTLIELLTVVAIITLLMSILMPVLAKVRQQAKTVVCQAGLKQWGIIWSMYVNDRNGFFPTWKWIPTGPNRSWPETLRLIYKEPKIRCCPEATQPMYVESGTTTGMRAPHAAWGKFSGRYPGYETRGDYGSYGYNGWAGNDEDATFLGPTDATNWKTPNVKNAKDVPIFLDATWMVAWADSRDEAPLYEGDPTFYANGHFMGVDMFPWCTNRHRNFYNNGLFLDWSVRKVSLKEMWRLKWHKKYNVNDSPSVWPEWLKKCPK